MHLPSVAAPAAALSLAVLLLAVLLLAGPACAQPPAMGAASRVAAVTLYPGSAMVERVAHVSAGARSLRLTCLPASFDVDSLRLEGDPGIVIGEVNAHSAPRSRAPGCERTALDKRITELEDQLAAIDADDGSNDLALSYLKGLVQGASASPAGGAPKPAANASTITETLQALRGAGQAALAQQHQIMRRKEALRLQLDPLVIDRDRLQRPDTLMRDITINLSATAAGDVRLRYQVAGPGWAPAYRAALNAATGQIRLERLAQVAQTSGEDWTGIRLRLSTGQPRTTAEPLPQPWRVWIQAANPPTPTSTMSAMPAAAPAPMAVAQRARGADEQPPSFDVSVFQGMYTTEFEVPGTVDLVSGDQRLTLSLGSQNVDGNLFVRATPNAEASAFLVAEIDRPAGVWPTGNLQLYRDGALVGTTRWTIGDESRVTFGFGRDDLVRVQREPDRTLNGNPSFIGGKVEHRIARAYTVRNLHTQPIRLEVLEATPVSGDEAVTITQHLVPAPTTTEWHKQPGVAQWEATLEPGATARYTAEYIATASKDARLGGWR